MTSEPTLPNPDTQDCEAESMLREINIWELRRYRQGLASVEEKLNVTKWLSENSVSDSQLDKFYTEIKDTGWTELSENEIQARVQSVLQKFDGIPDDTKYARLHKAGAKSVFPTQSSSSSKWLYTAISALVLTFALTFGWQIFSGGSGTAFTENNSYYSTADGERARIRLPDGTIVDLSVASKLEVPDDYVDGNRVVSLTGEAQFTVVHNSGTPFSVVAGPSITKVLGTRFMIRYFPTDTAAIIAVREGKVSVQNEILTVGQQVTVTSANHLVKSRASFADFASESGVLTIKPMRLSSAIVELERWYNVSIILSDRYLGEVIIDGEFTIGSLSDLAEQLELGLNVKVARDGKILTIYPR